MTKPRSFYVSDVHERYYHITSRCVRRAFLLGNDPLTGKNYDHRKDLFLTHLKHLARFYAVDIAGYAIMSNHFHLLVRYAPKLNLTWSDEEVARRWCAAFHGGPIDQPGPEQLDDFNRTQLLRYHMMLLDPDRIDHCRRALGSLSCFMQHLKQRVALWANREDGCTGHFFEARFYSGALLEESDLLSCMAYIDLNPVEAGIARSLREARHTSVHERLYAERFDSDELEAYLAPLWQDEAALEGKAQNKQINCTLRHYAEQLNHAIVILTQGIDRIPHGLAGWLIRLLNREKKNARHTAPFYDYA